ncbi:unnamed protein product [Vitrella brassicaformis CCMP3155]|uniref:Calcineurin-like phosphoesterase domain-containing protein n=1 Tax=Vitrella brassicaformis (strain CCMP3155) TaxID=1169540 RepID=A0A0G4G7P3_VITBC|nr:unnamed protein product [Vitrella brassicaformis CCMP3155]|eukprot:CEM24630.1 unnamed protein product [Vitrella brassicaformis CCMP3155]
MLKAEDILDDGLYRRGFGITKVSDFIPLIQCIARHVPLYLLKGNHDDTIPQTLVDKLFPHEKGDVLYRDHEIADFPQTTPNTGRSWITMAVGTPLTGGVSGTCARKLRIFFFNLT